MYDDYLRQIAEADTFERGNRITDGRYTWGTLGMKIEKKKNGVMFIAELLCLESAAVTVDPSLLEKGEQIELIKPKSVGETCGLVVNLSQGDSAFANVKSFVLGLDGSHPDKYNAKKGGNPKDFERMLGLAVGPAQPFRGAIVKSESYRQKIKVPKSPDRTVFLGHNWTHVKQALDEVAARRKDYDTRGLKGT
jgi:hypothetical protein